MSPTVTKKRELQVKKQCLAGQHSSTMERFIVVLEDEFQVIG